MFSFKFLKTNFPKLRTSSDNVRPYVYVMIAGLLMLKVLVTNNIHTQLYVLTEFSNNRDPQTGDCKNF